MYVIYTYAYIYIYTHTRRVAGRDTKAVAVGYIHINKAYLNIYTYNNKYICIYV